MKPQQITRQGYEVNPANLHSLPLKQQGYFIENETEENYMEFLNIMRRVFNRIDNKKDFNNLSAE